MMKKIIYGLLTSVILVSCNFDQLSPDSIPFDRGFENLSNIQALERGVYVRLRTAFSPYSMIVPDLQADYANAVYGFSNTYGDMYSWTFSQDEGEVESAWQNFYGCIGQCNFMNGGIALRLEKLEAEFSMTQDEVLAEELQAEIDELNLITGRLSLIRALCYSVLAERFCADYDVTTAGKQYSGLPLVLEYDPDDMPSRSTLAQVYEAINDDLALARELLKDTKGSQNATSINLDCVTALEARVLLQMDLHEEALDKANSLIGNTTYQLVETSEDFAKMWEYDQSTETIFQFFASETENAYQWGVPFWIDNYSGVGEYRFMVPDYIPSQSCVDTYTEEDWRRTAYFKEASMMQMVDDMWIRPFIKGHSAFAENLTLLYKYPGNPDLRSSSTWNYYNTFKVFRLAEQYLIAAEAAVMSDGDAKTPLNELRKHRGLEPLDEVTLEDVQNERYMEMIFEGTRLTDLKRWGLGLKRGKPQEGMLTENGMSYFEGSYVVAHTAEIEKTPDNYMFVWPIPASETSANAILEDQQNPGWER